MKKSVLEMSRFETSELAVRENERRITALKRSGKRFNELRYRLEDCSYGGTPCGSLACKICNRDLRIDLVDSAVSSITRSSIDTWELLTIIPYRKALDDKELIGFDLKAFKKWFGRAFRELGFTGPIWGMIEVDYHSYAEAWLPHFHVVLPKTSNNELAYERLKQSRTFYYETEFLEGTQNRPFQKDPFDVVDVVEVLSYTHKLYGSEFYLNSRRKKVKGVLYGSRLAEYLMFMDNHSYSELRFTLGVSDEKWAGLRKVHSNKRLEHHD